MALHKTHYRHFAAHALLASSSCIAYASQQPLRGAEKKNGPFGEDFERLANETLERWKCPGLSIAVVDGDETWATVSFGFLQCIDFLCLLLIKCIFKSSKEGFCLVLLFVEPDSSVDGSY
jgi:hypothetical protein